MSLLSHDRYQYDSLILSKQTWAYPCEHLQQLLWCAVSVRLNLPEVQEWKLCPLRYYANCVSTTLMVLILRNVESVCFFYSDPVIYNKHVSVSHCYVYRSLNINLDLCTPICSIDIFQAFTLLGNFHTLFTLISNLMLTFNYQIYKKCWCLLDHASLW